MLDKFCLELLSAVHAYNLHISATCWVLTVVTTCTTYFNTQKPCSVLTQCTYLLVLLSAYTVTTIVFRI